MLYRTPRLAVLAALALAACTSPSSIGASPPAPTPAPSPTPDRAPAPPQADDTDLARRILDRQQKLGPGFTAVHTPPFLVFGDDAPAAVRARAENTVKWAVDRLRQDFFRNGPARTLDVYLFKDAASYTAHATRMFGEEPSTPYGYYSSKHDALVMNIATGGGTLVHEIVHPFVEADFPEAPPWLNEGLGSLFEQCGDEGGHIVGYTNWRLPGLQKAIRSGGVPSFEALMKMDAQTFYEEDRGTNYAESRYLLYYLQQRGLLRRYYAEFRAARDGDPTGYATLKSVLGEADMRAFQRRWEQYVLGLVFR